MTKMVFDEVLSCLGWRVGLCGCLIKCLRHLQSSWVTFLSSSVKAVGVEGRF